MCLPFQLREQLRLGLPAFQPGLPTVFDLQEAMRRRVQLQHEVVSSMWSGCTARGKYNTYSAIPLRNKCPTLLSIAQCVRAESAYGGGLVDRHGGGVQRSGGEEGLSKGARGAALFPTWRSDTLRATWPESLKRRLPRLCIIFTLHSQRMAIPKFTGKHIPSGIGQVKSIH